VAAPINETYPKGESVAPKGRVSGPKADQANLRCTTFIFAFARSFLPGYGAAGPACCEKEKPLVEVTFHPEFPSGHTERIRNVGHCESPFWRGVFASFLPRGQKPGGTHHAAWCVSA